MLMTDQRLSPAPNDRLLMRRDRATGVEAVRARIRTYSYDMHTHDDEWLVGVTHDGVQDFFCRGKRRQSTRHRIILIEPSERHDGRSADPAGYAYSMLYIPRAWLRDELGSDEAVGFRETLADDGNLVEIIPELCNAILEGAPSLAIEHSRDRLLEQLRFHLGAAERKAEQMDAAVASRALEYLRSHYAEDVSTVELVRASGAASRFQLNRSFKSRYGTTPHASLVQIRLAKARSLLRNSVPLSLAAARCGFADQSHMTRWFQRAYGMPPGAYARGRTNVQDGSTHTA